jgi:hypothetical protein
VGLVLPVAADVVVQLARAPPWLAHDDHRAPEVCPDRVTLSPKLSVVAATRNDEHGGNQLSRTQLFLNGLADQAARFRYPLELLLVEWNPPADRPPLAEALSWPSSEWFAPKIVVVAPHLHHRFDHADGLPLFQMIAKNVGIRRAASDFVLTTNIDILLSDELFNGFERELKPNALYRVDRLDIEVDLNRKPLPTPAECRAQPWLRAHRRDGAHYPDGRRDPWYVRGRSRVNRAVWDATHGGSLPDLFTWGCGDFTLTTKAVWEGMHGYPEWTMYSFHLDSLALVMAYAAGVDMVVFSPPRVAYHLEHGAGSGWTPEGARRLFGRLDAAGVPYLSGTDYDRVAREILSQGRGFHPLTGSGWGLASADLPVVVPA